jgi:hypothetical protein
MKLVQDFPFMREHLHSFPPSLWSELHAVLKKAAAREDVMSLLADSGLHVQENETGFFVGVTDVKAIGAGKDPVEAVGAFAMACVDEMHEMELTLHEQKAQLEIYAPH